MEGRNGEREAAFFARLTRHITNLHRIEDSLADTSYETALTPLQHRILLILLNQGPGTLSALSHCLRLNLPNGSREVKKLAALGLVAKEGSPADRRVIRISLTTEGRRIILGVMERMTEGFLEKLGPLTEETLTECGKALDALDGSLIGPFLDSDGE